MSFSLFSDSMKLSMAPTALAQARLCSGAGMAPQPCCPSVSSLWGRKWGEGSCCPGKGRWAAGSSNGPLPGEEVLARLYACGSRTSAMLEGGVLSCGLLHTPHWVMSTWGTQWAHWHCPVLSIRPAGELGRGWRGGAFTQASLPNAASSQSRSPKAPAPAWSRPHDSTRDMYS